MGLTIPSIGLLCGVPQAQGSAGKDLLKGEFILRRMWAAALAVAALSLLASTSAFASGEPQLGAHVLPNLLAEKQGALREFALKQQLAGKIPADANVAKVGETLKGKGQY